MSKSLVPALCLCAALASWPGHVAAQAAGAPRAVPVPEGVRVPTWRELTPQQREDLARLEAEWDHLPASRRVGILERHARWQQASPKARETWREGERNFRQMSPQQREQMRRSLAAVRDLPPEQQRRLRKLWQSLSPEQRRLWLERGGPGLSPPPPPAARAPGPERPPAD